ncbi:MULTISPECIES: phospholipase D-like domain-containing protein [unclassified Schaalia]|uniref:phospholipase D-like domain-containing protein n=1 Tax=unclassified Schaalia TaxID=2691889 RepID=UPI0015F371C0
MPPTPPSRSARRARLLRIARTGALVAGAAQFTAVGAVYAIDKVRKMRIPGGQHGFPTMPPQEVLVGDNAIQAYTEGTTLYADMIKAIDSAKTTVFFETYVWRSDAVGFAFKEALVRAAQRGVEVFVIYDGFGSFKSAPALKFFPNLPTLHVHRVKELRIGLFLGDMRRTGRNHRKILVVDDAVGFVGGFNIGKDFGMEWRDTHIRLVGPAVRILSVGAQEFWNTFRDRDQPMLPEGEELPWDDQITAAFNLPSHLLFPVRLQYIDAFRRATQSLEITTAYFIPDREILRELVLAARRGVKVRVLIPEYSNHILADWVARPYFGELLGAGVEIWLYQHAMIHSKTVVSDGFRSIVGTANIDRLSMMGNFEVTMQIDDPGFAERMEAIFENDLTTARPLTIEEWMGRPIVTRVLERLVRAFNLVV